MLGVKMVYHSTVYFIYCEGALGPNRLVHYAFSVQSWHIPEMALEKKSSLACQKTMIF